ncbi:MAG: helix-turn-helix transcriptional regulator [Myxococcales bacterium]|nr:helix-turn-helix transcriptional regulator [Myxococcales bacterium]
MLMLEQEAAMMALAGATIARAKTLDNADAVRDALTRLRRGVWVSLNAETLASCLAVFRILPSAHRILLLNPISRQRLELLRASFEYVVGAVDDGFRLLPRDELIDVMLSDYPGDRFIGVAADREAGALVLLRGDLQPLVVPLTWFRRVEGFPAPDPTDAEIIDWGHTLRMGEYEAAADAILYDFDAAFRKRAKAKRVERDNSFGGALRRLRLARGLSRGDFPGISAKEIARIERGEVSAPHADTLARVAKVLRVKPEEIQTY